MRMADCHPERKHASRGLCRTCVTREDQQANPEKWKAYARRHYLKKNYGMTPEDYDALLLEQVGHCACCGTDEPNGKHGMFYIDHVHGTQIVRGLLCHSCNTGIGSLGDTAAGLRKALAYLERSEHGEGTD